MNAEPSVELRCPLDPANGPLAATPAGDGLVCQRCGVVYRVREGIPCMIPEEATLPPGCDGLSSLPCRQAPAPQRANP
jgi:uncharacterized protein YbaR (Trm112 family)